MEPKILKDTGNGQPDLRQAVSEGLLYAHSRLNANTAKTLEAASFLYALIELLSESGIITIEGLDERKQAVGCRLAEEFKQKSMGAMLQDPEYDKYNFNQETTIDCEARIHRCRGACCRIPFALSKQDIHEGIVRWDLGRPYLIEHGDGGYCIHMKGSTHTCGIYQNRPVPCRAFNCSGDERIWLDFANMVENPDINRNDWPECLGRKETPDDH
jgi:Fe-S-cluster containining protein